MNHYSGAVPDTEPAGQWLKRGACKDDADAMFPGTGAAKIETAKAVCRSCPVLAECKQWALESREQFGVWGGMSEAERRSLLRRRGIRTKNDDPDRKQRGDRTLQDLWDERTQPADGGHLVWAASMPVSFHGHCYTPQRIGFEVDRGYTPTGMVRRVCSADGCVLPAHLMDQAERDARDLRRTGTTKSLAS